MVNSGNLSRQEIRNPARLVTISAIGMILSGYELGRSILDTPTQVRSHHYPLVKSPFMMVPLALRYILITLWPFGNQTWQ